MAIFESFLLGNLRQKLANLVMYKSQGKGIVRGRPMKIRNPRTLAQLTQRAKMKLAVDMSRQFAPANMIGFAGRPQGISVYNAFVRANVVNVSVDDELNATLDVRKVICAEGVLTIPNISAALKEDGKTITVTQTEQDSSGTSNDDDRVYVCFYDSAQKSSRLLSVGNRKLTATAEFVLPKQWNVDSVHLYAFAVSKSKRRSSSTVYIELS